MCITTTTADSGTRDDTANGAIDEQRAAEFGEQLFGYYTGAFTTFMIDLGHRVGLFEAATRGPATSTALARRAQLEERYVREWLGAMVTVGIFDYEADSETYALPEENAICLAGRSELNIAPMSSMAGSLAKHIRQVESAFRNGGGVAYSEYRPDFTDVMDGLSRPTFDGLLVEAMVPLVDGLTERLRAGADVADIGCGTGHSTNVLARAFPASRFTGYDLADDALAKATGEASQLGVENVEFETRDVSDLGGTARFDAVFAFDAIHDQADPAGVLAEVYESLRPGGVFVMLDIRASSRLERNVEHPFAPILYAISTLHCMPVSLAEGGAGLGTVWGEELAIEMLGTAGFVDLEVHEVEGDPIDSVYVARKR